MPSRDGSPTTSERGYGAEHMRRRKQDARAVEAGQGVCWRCGRVIVPRKVLRRDGRWVSNWHLGHDDWDRTVYRGPEHEKCNIGAVSRKAAHVRAGRRRARLLTVANPSRQW